MQNKKVIVGLSGGVDSAVAALLLQEQGYTVSGLFMQNWNADPNDPYCTAEQDLSDAKSVCDALQIPFDVINFAQEYWDRVFSYCLDEFHRGRTPNPDIWCNKEIKFNAFLTHALALGADYIATGHYAAIDFFDDHFHLLKAHDQHKDQSYFLYTLGQYELAHTLFPLATLTKPEVRAIAKKAGLLNCDKKDSTGICFIGERNFKEFLQGFVLAQPGPIQTTEGKTIGQHEGLMFYTLGQRKGLQIGGLNDYSEMAWYVVHKDLQKNALIVGQGHHHPRLLSQSLRADTITWVIETLPHMPLRCTARTRYHQPDQTCTIQLVEDILHVQFDTPQRAITPGQSVVFYQDRECLGGGIIL